MKMIVGFVFVMLFITSEARNHGNSLVTCATCQALQIQFDSWKCDVNCQVVKGNNDSDVTHGVITDLIDRVHRLEQQNEAKDTLYATAEDGGTNEQITISTGVIFKFPNELVDRLDSYETTTGILTIKKPGMYSILIICRSTDQVAFLTIYIKKPGETEKAVCISRANVSWMDASCSVLHQLDAGDEVYVKGSSNGSTLDVKTILQIFFLY